MPFTISIPGRLGCRIASCDTDCRIRDVRFISEVVMARSTKYGKRKRIERARQRLEYSGQQDAGEFRKPCCPDCEQAARRGALLGDFFDIREALALTEQQSRKYWAWVSKLGDSYGDAGEQLEEVSITFTLTPLGRLVVAHTQHVDARAEEHCTLDQEY